MQHNYKTFVFENYKIDTQVKKIYLSYSFDSKIHFTEELELEFDFVKDYSRQALDNAIIGLWIMAGISYFKAVLPTNIQFKKGGISERQKYFFEKTYRLGLGVFFYENNICPREKMNFPILSKGNSEKCFTSEKIPGLFGSIVPIGGGKDSLVTAEILKKSGEDIEAWTVGDRILLNNCCEKIGVSQLKIIRKIDPQIFNLNEKGALNGHIPISAILSFLSVITAILRGKKNVVFSNESSANEANLEFHGMQINHQYSKTLEFEKDFQSYVRDFISPDINYFSFLRPLSELKIAEIFCVNFFEKYRSIFSSCNRNFYITKTESRTTNFEPRTWCGICPKCVFVFAIFSPFLDREKLICLFGKNLFEDVHLEVSFNALLGVFGNKPFECVGEIAEVRKAISMSKKTGDWPELDKFNFLELDYDYEQFSEHAMPISFKNLLKKYI